ncbi:hypothetical protein SI65_08898 [Aspergillus cristatus]|uniref:RRM domain-containing protein n=1 Tax=Aspergillus cristatus TaxID=573508 RepID=A0A1E3B419_ASPCR|nr:hypothetical protein SI65_08898 [Aspergillus cristatus]
MSGKLDKSLDEILVNHRQSTRRRGGARRGKAGAAGGIRKTKATKPTGKAAGKAAQPAVAPTPTDSKIMVSGLPVDVNEANIKEYFTKSAGPVKRVMLTYGPNGTSRGIASIIFGKPDTAAKAAKELNGLLVDGKPMKIEVVVDATRAPAVPEPKSLTERVAQSAKSQPKPATGPKPAGAGRRGRRAPRRGAGRPNRPQKKSKEDLDAEMDDYFVSNESGGAPAAGNAPVNGQAQPATNGGEDVGMAEIS